MIRPLAFLSLLLTGHAAHAACAPHRVAELPITLWQNKLFVPVNINGAPRMMFVDTGAAITTLAADTAAALNLPRDYDHTADAFGVGGIENHLYLVHTRSLTVGGITFTARTYPVAEFPPPAPEGVRAAGLVGADILSHYDLDIDIPHRRLGLWDASGCNTVTPDWTGPTGTAALEIAPSHHIGVPVRLDGVALTLMLDTGSPELLLSTRAAARAGVPPEQLEEGRTMQGRGVNERSFNAWLHIFTRLDIAGDIYGDVRAVVVNNGRVSSGDGLLGVEFLKRGRVWVSYATSRLFLERGRQQY